MAYGLMEDEVELMRKLDALRDRHERLDSRLSEMMADQLETVRLKKEKLSLKDQIYRLEEMLYPDIIA